MNVTGVVLVLFALVSVAVMAYRAGYLRGQDDLLHWNRSTEVARNALSMTAVLRRWRRLAGLAAYGFAGLLTCLFLGLAFLYAKRWGWTVLLAAWALWFALFIGAIWLAEWCWQPYRAAQERLGMNRQRHSKHSKGAPIRRTPHDRRHRRPKEHRSLPGHPDHVGQAAHPRKPVRNETES